MSEQTNLAAEQEESTVNVEHDVEQAEEGQSTVAEDATEATAAAQASADPAQVAPAQAAPVRRPVSVVDADDDDRDDDDDDYDDEDEEDDDYGGPMEYVQREKGGRSRVGTDVRFEDINYKNIAVLSRFLDRRGRIMSRRKTRVSAKVQRRIQREVKRARHLALLPYTADQTRIVTKRR